MLSKVTGCNTRTVCLYNTNVYFLQMAAGGDRNIESNQFAIDVSCFTFSQRYKNELSVTRNLGRRFLPASVSIDILSLILKLCLIKSQDCMEYPSATPE